MLIHTIHAALEDAKKAFNRVRVCIAAHIFFRAVIDALMICEVLTKFLVLPRFISHQGYGVGYVFGKLLPERLARNVIDVEGAAPVRHARQGKTPLPCGRGRDGSSYQAYGR
jgi:hypothetical protein